MTIAVFGGTGRAGRQVVDVARETGHEVRALVRSPGKVPDDWAHVEIVEGDALDRAAVRETIRGTDAVVSVLGHAEGSPPDLLQRSIRHILDAMESEDVGRLIAMTGAGVERPQDDPGLIGRLFSGLLALLQGNLLEDSQVMVEQIEASEVDWTIVRGVRLRDGPERGAIAAGYLGDAMTPFVRRADVARFIVDQIDDDTWVGKAPAVGTPSDA